MNTEHLQYDYLIVGSGAAGLLAAKALAAHGTVALINKGKFEDSNTYHAQGGIAGVFNETDSIEEHVADTLRAGAGLCHEDVVRVVSQRGGAMIRKLLAWGTPFDANDEGLHLTREAGHSHRRIAHAKDATGRAIGETLLKHVQSQTKIDCFQNHIAIDLVTTQHLGNFHGVNRCLGAYFLKPDGSVVSIAARHTILATGGAGKVYMYTSNPHAATGDGIAMAWRAGCKVRNMEMMQFHPTCLFHPHAPSMLLSEALRGEGAHVVDAAGRRFVFDYDAQGELAPRDIVARAIDHEIKKQGKDCMFLDVTVLGEALILKQFPNIHRRLMALGLDMRSTPIPIVPAAHYMCGGVATNLTGETDVACLYVIGESACTGLHGANRLASNSLLECLVMAEACSQKILADISQHVQMIPAWDDAGIVPEAERIQIKQNWDEIRAVMSHYVGIVRSDLRLRRAKRRLLVIQEEIANFYWRHPLSRDLIELRNLALVAELVVRSAQQRHESRGLHCSTDYPESLAVAKDTELMPE